MNDDYLVILFLFILVYISINETKVKFETT